MMHGRRFQLEITSWDAENSFRARDAAETRQSPRSSHCSALHHSITPTLQHSITPFPPPFLKLLWQKGLQKAMAMRLSRDSPRMHESLISACQVMDTLGLPRAVADFESDRFIFANNSFLRVAGIKEPLLPTLPFSGIVKIHAGSVAWESGHLIPIRVESYDQGFIIRGHAVFGDHGLIYLMVPPFGDPSVDFELGRSVGKEQERQRLSRYLNQRLMPVLQSAIESIEAARVYSGDKQPPSDAGLEKAVQSLSGLLQAARAEIIQEQEQERPVAIESS